MSVIASADGEKEAVIGSVPVAGRVDGVEEVKSTVGVNGREFAALFCCCSKR